MDVEKAKAYFSQILGEYDKDPAVLHATERKLLTKYKEAEVEATELAAQLNQLRENIAKAQAQSNDLTSKFTTAQGRANGILEALFELKPDDSVKTSESAPKQTSGNRKSRRTAASKSGKKSGKKTTRKSASAA